MIQKLAVILLTWSIFANFLEATTDSTQTQQVVLLHGLARSAASMNPLAEHLRGLSYKICNVAYPSTEHPIAVLATDYVLPSIRRCFPDAEKPINFVTHSLGGIITRQLARSNPELKFGRVVMLAPPNHGSEIVDKLGELWLFQMINGPSGTELGTNPESLPNRLGPAQFEVGIITGNFSINWILSAMIEGTDDGKVSIESAKLDGMSDFRVVSVSHPFIMKDHEVWRFIVNFLTYGAFSENINDRSND